MSTIAMGLVIVMGVAMGMPVAFAVLGGAVVYFLLSPLPDLLVVQRMVSGVEAFPFLAIPLFILAGTAMANGGMAYRLLDLADAVVGHHRGGLAQVNVLNSFMMGGMSGSANADAAIDAKILVPVMVRKGYGLGFSSALSAATGVLVPLLPPSIGLIIYGLLAQVSVGRLFIAGIIPGILVGVVLMITVRWISIRRGYGAQRTRPLPAREILRIGRRAIWALAMPFLLIIGLRIGVFTPTELGAVAACYALTVAVFLYREIRSLASLVEVFSEAVRSTSAVMLIVSASAAFAAAMTLERIPQTLIEILLGVSSDPVIILLILNVALLILGMVMESTALLILLTPIVAPMALLLGVDPVHFGIIFALNLIIGAITPPVGTVLYTVCSITGCSIGEYTRELLPMLLGLIAVLLIVTYLPAVSLTLPNLLLGP